MGVVLLVLFLLVPIVEIYVIVQVGQEIGAWPTVALLLVESLLGAVLVKREGRRAWAALRAGAESGRMPTGELADAGLVLVGGTLLLTPGFVTDIAGFFLILPLTRPLARRVLGWLLARQASRIAVRRFGPGVGGVVGGSFPRRDARGGGPARPTGPVVPGEVVDDDGP